MATLTFTIDEALSFLRANNLLPDAIRDIRAGGDGLRVTVSGGIDIQVRQESFHSGILRLSYSSDSWAFKFADKFGKVDSLLDTALRPYPFLHRDGKSLVIDLNSALQAYAKGVRIKEFELRDGSLRIEA